MGNGCFVKFSLVLAPGIVHSRAAVLFHAEIILTEIVIYYPSRTLRGLRFFYQTVTKPQASLEKQPRGKMRSWSDEYEPTKEKKSRWIRSVILRVGTCVPVRDKPEGILGRYPRRKHN